MKKPHANSGFSLAELLVTLLVGGIMVSMMVRGYIAQNRSSENEAALRDMNVKAQLAMNQIKHLIRNAGLGAEGNLGGSGEFIEGAHWDFSDVFTVEPRSDGPDTLTVVSGFPVQAFVDCSEGVCTSNSIDVDDASNFDTGTRRYVYVGPSVTNQYVEIDQVAGDTLTLSQPVSAFHNDPVYRPTAYTITLDMDEQGNPMDVDGDGSTSDGDTNNSPDLYIYDNLEDLTDEADAKVTDEIEALQFQYLIDTDENGIVEDAEWTTWHDNPAGNLDNIRAVRIWVLVRSSIPDPAFEDPHEYNGVSKQYRVADQLIQLDTNDNNGIDSHFDHHYHRILLVETVMVRNRNL